MNGAWLSAGGSRQSSLLLSGQQLRGLVRAAAPALLFGLRLWASVCLALYVAFWLELDNPFWAGTTAAIVCQPSLGASLRKGWYRMIGTVVGAMAIVVMTACFPQDRAAFLVSLALWGAACALVATLLRNFAAYSAALAGYTAAIIASDQLGTVGGLNGQAFTLAVDRASEICIGIVCAGIILMLTDLGGARRRLATLFAAISAEIAGRFTGTLVTAGAEFENTQTIRRELVRRVIALDPVIDEALGEVFATALSLPGLAGSFGRIGRCPRQLAHGGACAGAIAGAERGARGERGAGPGAGASSREARRGCGGALDRRSSALTPGV